MLLRLENSFNSMMANVRHVERIANNLANASTVGFRQDRLFTEALNERLDPEGSPRSHRVMTQFSDQTKGALDQTGNPLDVALDGDGYFVVSQPETGIEQFTRAGHFIVDDEGTLRTPAGLVVEGATGPIELPSEGGAIDIRRNGDVLVDGNLAGTLRIVQFEQPGSLERIDGASFLAGEQTPQEIDEPSVVQGYLESSNVNALESMTELIAHSRIFETQQKALSSTDLYLQRATRELSRF
jgi:flagellar basal-body rod protein FlgF/flagellar basal-body rod protein FlgG